MASKKKRTSPHQAELASALPLCVVLGGGGHAQVLLECLRLTGIAKPVAILDPDSRLVGQRVMDVPVRGGDDLLPTLRREGVRFFVAGIGGVGDNSARKLAFERGLAAGMEPLTLCHPSVICSPSAIVQAGSVLLARAVVNTAARIGMNVIVNTGAIVEHHCEIQNHVHLASGVCLASSVRVEEEAHIGIGAVVRQGLVIGRKAIVGAGAVVVKAVGAGTCVVGVPAELLRRHGRRAGKETSRG